MMQELSLQVQAMLDIARLSAALQKRFRPADLMAEVTEGADLSDPVLMIDVLSLLREDCVVDGDHWIMRPSPRRKVLAAEKGRTGLGVGTTLTPVQQALEGVGDFEPDRLDALMAEPGDTDLAALAATLDQAGPNAPAYEQLVALRAALNGQKQSRRNDEILEKGFFGREEALRDLADWLAHPQQKQPLRSWHISGLPGIGKSYLLEKVIQSARLAHKPILIRLDFDRAALDVLNPYALFEEISRQMADAVPAAAPELRKLRQQSAAERLESRPATKMRQLPRKLLRGLAAVANDSARTVLFVLDTLEVLRGRGETHIITLFEHLDLLLDYGMQRVTIISAGRGDALAPAPRRMKKHTALSGLEDWAAEALLKKRGVDPALWPRILPLAKGNPLLLTLAGRALSEEGISTDDLPDEADVTTVGGYLYRAILSRVPKDLRAVANQGLTLRAINLETLQNVVAPPLGLEMTEAAAANMLETLATHHWLVERDNAGWISHRSDVRAAFLPLIYADDPQTMAAINRAAVAWFDSRDPEQALYHRLQLMRAGDPAPEVNPTEAAAFTQPMLDDLPDLARDLVLQARGNRSDFGRAEAPSTNDRLPSAEPSELTFEDIDRFLIKPFSPASPGSRTIAWSSKFDRLIFDAPGTVRTPDKRALTDLHMMLERGDVREAQYIVEESFDAPFPIASDAAILVICEQWLAGRWSAVERLWPTMGFDVLARVLDDKDHVRGRLMLEIAAEFDFDVVVDAIRDQALPDFAIDLIQNPPAFGMERGALDFALLVARGRFVPIDRTIGHVAHLMEPSEPEAGRAAVYDADRLRSRTGVEIAESAYSGIYAVMPLNPYGSFLAARAPLFGVLQEAEERPDIAQVARLFAPGLTRWEFLSDTILHGIADKIDVAEGLGLTAEFAGGLTAYHRLPDLPLIAAAAERWRRTVAGVWSYGSTPPEGWTGQVAGMDDGAVALMDHLLADANSVEQARAALTAWMPDDGDAARLVRRYGRRYNTVMSADLPEAADSPRAAVLEAYKHLTKADVPMVVAAPLAILAAHQFNLDRI
ncbi:ATP-binding protein [Yoonia sp. R2-816]|uniref:ATP-binding protein n=1 Tax=Yoonia sp. R2-816 TaxID=3342638 RepID=UPI00372B1722